MIIAAYPRSGSAWLRFILCHLLYPRQELDGALRREILDRNLAQLKMLGYWDDSPEYQSGYQI